MRSKRFYISILTLIISWAANAQQNRPVLSETAATGIISSMSIPPDVDAGSNPSYIRTFTPLIPQSDTSLINITSPSGEVRKQTVYLDGSQKPFQKINHDVSSVNGQLRHLIEIYDNRPLKEQYGFLPYPTSQTGLQSNAFGSQQTYYSGLYPNEGYTSFSKSVNTSTDNERSQTNYAPGKGHVGLSRGVKTKAIGNVASEVIIWELDVNGIPTANGFYAANQLSGVETSAPDNTGSNSNNTSPRSRVYNDRDGKTILKMISDGISTYQYTYYVYDEMGKLTCIITPKAFKYYQDNSALNGTVLRNLCFQYKYDAKGRQYATQKPGEKGFTYLVFDRKDRPVMQQTPSEAQANKWEITFYDPLDRVKATSLFTDNSALSATSWQTELDNAAINGSVPGNLRYYIATTAGEVVYPQDNTISGNVMMTYDWYDNYNAVDPTGNRLTSLISRLSFSELVTDNGSEVPERSLSFYSLRTGSRVRILSAPGANVSKTGEWKNSLIFYDKKGRVIYTQTSTVNGTDSIHHDIAGIQYDFADRVLTTKHRLINNNSTDGYTSHTEIVLNEYSTLTAIPTRSLHKVDNGAWRILCQYTYDEQGRIKRKSLGNGAEVQDYSYNLRGQLTGINKDYAETGLKGGYSRTFGQSLKYDFGFEKPRFDGKMAGMIWRGSSTADMMAYGYDYTQDGALKFADFNKYISSSWTHTNIDYSTHSLAYDKNGNLTNMTQRGVHPVNGAVNMDVLQYNYDSSGNSNRLMRISDGGVASYGAGDFEDQTSGSEDYSYDFNGNLTSDANKGIGSVTYTHFNKPITVTFTNGNTISYSYDANGNKVQEITTSISPSLVKRTDYVGNFIYEDDTLQYSLTNEGRTVYNTTLNTHKEEFFVKDHLGNIRSVVEVARYDLIDYLATHELASANLENLIFEGIDDVRDTKPGDSGMAANLNGGDASRRIGTSLLVHVMAGDRISMNVDNYYASYEPTEDDQVDASTMLGSIIGTLTSGAGGFPGSEMHDLDMVSNTFTPENFGTFESLISPEYDDSKPKAYLNYILFDENLKVVNAMSGAFQVNGAGTWTEIGTTEPLEIPKNGYLAVYLSNASNSQLCGPCGDVYFDRLQVQISKGSLLQETHYYPHGLPIYGLGSTSVNFKSNRRKYQSKEYITDLKLNWMDFNARQYDPQIGRFLGVDPMADGAGQERFSPYAAMGNMPESTIDPNGTVIQNTIDWNVGIGHDYAQSFGSETGGGGGGALAGLGGGNPLAGDNSKGVDFGDFGSGYAARAQEAMSNYFWAVTELIVGYVKEGSFNKNADVTVYEQDDFQIPVEGSSEASGLLADGGSGAISLRPQASGGGIGSTIIKLAPSTNPLSLLGRAFFEPVGIGDNSADVARINAKVNGNSKNNTNPHGVYMIYKFTGQSEVQKYGISGRVDMLDRRPQYQVNKLNKGKEGAVYNWMWVAYNLPNRQTALIVELYFVSMYLKAHGELPPRQFRPDPRKNPLFGPFN